MYSYETPKMGERRGFNAKELEEGAISLCNALVGKYRDLSGQLRPVAGDMTKLRYAEGLSPAAQRLVLNIEHTSRNISGCQEVRRLTRFDTHANRVNMVCRFSSQCRRTSHIAC